MACRTSSASLFGLHGSEGLPYSVIDVPDDLLASLDATASGWESPPSPLIGQQLTPPPSPARTTNDCYSDSNCDPMMFGNNTGSSTCRHDLYFHSAVGSAEIGQTVSPKDEWDEWALTPPASPVPCSVIGADDFMANFPPDLDLHGLADPDTPFDHTFRPLTAEAPSPLEAVQNNSQLTPPASPLLARPSQKRKCCSAPVLTPEAKRIRDKARIEAERQQNIKTAECDKAVEDLAATKTGSGHPDTPASRRHTHNVLERKRRNDLKISYQILRETLPSLAGNDKAPTVQILRSAIDEVHSLQKDEGDLIDAVAAAKSENARLKELLASLHRW